MKHANNFYSLRLAPNVFQRHRNPEQDKVGESFDDADDAKATKWGTEHEH
jgi:hypothetical protein